MARLRAFNAEVMRLRALEQRGGAPGRYAWEYRLTVGPQAQQAAAWLNRFATLAQRNGVDQDAVFAARGGRRRSRSHQQRRRGSHAEQGRAHRPRPTLSLPLLATAQYAALTATELVAV